MCGTFEPRVLFEVREEGENVKIKCGLNMHFKSSTLLKGLIIKSSKEEHDSAWNELKNLIYNVA